MSTPRIQIFSSYLGPELMDLLGHHFPHFDLALNPREERIFPDLPSVQQQLETSLASLRNRFSANRTFLFLAFYLKPIPQELELGRLIGEQELMSANQRLNCFVHLHRRYNRVASSFSSADLRVGRHSLRFNLALQAIKNAYAKLDLLPSYVNRCSRLELSEDAIQVGYWRKSHEAMAHRIRAIYPDITVNPSRYMLIDATTQSRFAHGVSKQLGGEVAIFPRLDYQKRQPYVAILLVPQIASRVTLAGCEFIQKMNLLIQQPCLIVGLEEGQWRSGYQKQLEGCMFISCQ